MGYKIILPNPPEGFSRYAEWRSPEKDEWFISDDMYGALQAIADYSSKRIVLRKLEEGENEDRIVNIQLTAKNNTVWSTSAVTFLDDKVDRVRVVHYSDDVPVHTTEYKKVKKKKTHFVNDVEVPAPLTEIPLINTEVWCYGRKKTSSIIWDNAFRSYAVMMDNGLLFSSKEDAEENRQAKFGGDNER